MRLFAIESNRAPGVSGLPAEPFTLIFHGPRGDILGEGLHGTTTEDGTRFAFYIMPIHTPALDRQEYQAVFN